MSGVKSNRFYLIKLRKIRVVAKKGIFPMELFIELKCVNMSNNNKTGPRNWYEYSTIILFGFFCKTWIP